MKNLIFLWKITFQNEKRFISFGDIPLMSMLQFYLLVKLNILIHTFLNV